MNKKKFLDLVSKEKSHTLEKNKERIERRAMLRESQQIALKVLMKLDELGWSQRRLAEVMGVSPPQISKIVKGQENLTLETQVKLQEILDIPVLASYYEKNYKAMIIKTQKIILPVTPYQSLEDYSISVKKDFMKIVCDPQPDYKKAV